VCLKTFALSALLGLGNALVASYVLKRANMKSDPVRESCIILLIAFTTYMLCEQIDLSGVVAIFVLGVVLSHYAYNNMAYDAKLGSVMAVEMMSFVAETVVYVFCGRHLALRVFLGYSERDSERAGHSSSAPAAADRATPTGQLQVNAALWLTLTAVVIVARLAAVLLIAALSRLLCLRTAFDWKRQAAMLHGGCVRGTVAFALAIALPGQSSFSPCVDATLAIVLITTLFVTPLFNVTLKCVKLGMC
jgi:NhaP-type Na+/H+ or K+/H+ antiporter